MKSTFIAALFIFSTLASAGATITNSEISPRHLKLITKSIAEECHLKGELKEVSTSTRSIEVDQGVIDVFFNSKFILKVRIDQGQYDNYEVHVQSAIYSGYDHESMDWGLIEVQSVSCKN